MCSMKNIVYSVCRLSEILLIQSILSFFMLYCSACM